MGAVLAASCAMRADPRFLPLVEKLGLMVYWRATKAQPNVCETEDVLVLSRAEKGGQAIAFQTAGECPFRAGGLNRSTQHIR